MKIIEPAGGIGNRLRVVLTALKVYGPDTVFLWRENRDCACKWGDLFERPLIHTIPAAIPKVKHTRTCSALTYLEPSLYRDVIPARDISNSVQAFTLSHSRFDAIHVRRTDHTGLAKKAGLYTPDENFFAFIDATRSARFFLACDDPATVKVFTSRYGERCLTRRVSWIDGHRKTTPQDALIDLLICAYADRFLGSGYSSFSDTINLMRG